MRNKFRIVLAGHVGRPFGGIATFCEALMNSSLPHREQVYFIETSRGGFRVSDRGQWLPGNFIDAAKNIFNFFKSLLIIRPRLVHVMTAHHPSMLKHGVMVLLARVVGVKVILHPHCSVEAMFPARGGWLNFITRFIFRQCQAILVLSTEWLALKNDFPEVPFAYLPNGIDLFPLIEVPRGGGRSNSAPIHILYLGHLGFAKGTIDLLESISILKDLYGMIAVDLVGEPFEEADRQEILSTIERLHLEHLVHLSPPVYGSRKIHTLSQADIFVLPSHQEGMPISIIESMAAGLPIIASAVGGIPELITDGLTGLLVPHSNPTALAAAISKLVRFPQLREQMGRAAREEAQRKYDIEKVVPILLEYYQRVEQAG